MAKQRCHSYNTLWSLEVSVHIYGTMVSRTLSE